MAAFRVSAARAADAMERKETISSMDASIIADALLAQRKIDPKQIRRIFLDRYWRKFYPGVARCAAAKLIAADWAAADGRHGFIEAGSRADSFRRLADLGFKRVGVSTIITDLDPDM